jgi:hypothetical protein
VNFLKYLEEVRKMKLPLGKYAILGSGPLAVRGIRDTRDVDLIVTPDVYSYYKKQKGWKLRCLWGNFFLRKGKVELWKRVGFWKPIVDISAFIERAEVIDGLPFVNLQDFLSYKRRAFRAKDKVDVGLAEEYLASR